MQIISSQLPAARGATRKLHYSRASVFRYIGRVCMRRAATLELLLGPRSTTGRHFRTALAARRSWCLVGSAGSPHDHRSSLWCRCARCLRAELQLSENRTKFTLLETITKAVYSRRYTLINILLERQHANFWRLCALRLRQSRGANILLGSLSQAQTVS